MTDKIRKLDPSFNEETFISKAKNIYITMMMSITSKDITRAYASLSQEVRNKVAKKINALNEKKEISMHDELNVKEFRITNVDITDEFFIIEAKLVARYLDYYLDEDTKAFKHGDKEDRVVRNNTLTFRCKRNHKDLSKVSHCPNCGGNVDYNYSGLCPYCKGQFPKEDYDFILVDWEEV
jgi:hypothetical protein